MGLVPNFGPLTIEEMGFLGVDLVKRIGVIVVAPPMKILRYEFLKVDIEDSS